MKINGNLLGKPGCQAEIYSPEHIGPCRVNKELNPACLSDLALLPASQRLCSLGDFESVSETAI